MPARAQGVEAAYRLGDFVGAGFALNAHGPDHDVCREALFEAVEHVADDCASGRGDHADDEWEVGQGLFALVGKQALSCKLFLALFQKRHQGASACRLQGFNHDLVLGGAREGRDAALGDNFHALFRLEFQPAENAAPNDSVDLRFVVLDAEVAMAGTMRATIA